MEKRENIICDSAKEQTLNFYAELQMLEDEGKDVGELKEEAWQRLLAYAEEDKEEQLARLREELLTYTELKREEKHSKLVQEMWEDEKQK